MTDTVPILNALIHPPIGALARTDITGLFTGSGNLTRPGAFPPFNNVAAYGLTWDFFTVPAGFGSTPGNPVVYEERMVQLSTVHTDILGHDIVSEYHAFSVEGIYWLWENPGPTRIHYEIAPGVQIIFWWLTL